MFKRVMFRWQDQDPTRPAELRSVWVETLSGQQACVPFLELDAWVGEAERRRVVAMAIRRGSGRWHGWHLPKLPALPALAG